MDVMLWTCRHEEERRNFDVTEESHQDRPPLGSITISRSGTSVDNSLSRPRAFAVEKAPTTPPPLLIQASASFSIDHLVQEDDDDCDGTLDGVDVYNNKEQQLMQETSTEGWLFDFWDVVIVALCGFPREMLTE